MHWNDILLDGYFSDEQIKGWIKESYLLVLSKLPKNFREKYFNNTILPILILVLTIYFTNTNEQNLANILITTITSIVSIVVTGSFITKIKDINITPVRKKENLLELKRVLMDIKIKWE